MMGYEDSPCAFEKPRRSMSQAQSHPGSLWILTATNRRCSGALTSDVDVQGERRTLNRYYPPRTTVTAERSKGRRLLISVVELRVPVSAAAFRRQVKHQPERVKTGAPSGSRLVPAENALNICSRYQSPSRVKGLAQRVMWRWTALVQARSIASSSARSRIVLSKNCRTGITTGTNASR